MHHPIRRGQFTLCWAWPLPTPRTPNGDAPRNYSLTLVSINCPDAFQPSPHLLIATPLLTTMYCLRPHSKRSYSLPFAQFGSPARTTMAAISPTLHGPTLSCAVPQRSLLLSIVITIHGHDRQTPSNAKRCRLPPPSTFISSSLTRHNAILPLSISHIPKPTRPSDLDEVPPTRPCSVPCLPTERGYYLHIR
ncbi:hypothetical protein FA13DRAFT_1455661 [Coprinellus micaceus]|uniref:Uncharacterized protein n=1 Tax=Coprinellus micaceus TaxID=71717 RepID=A0A4Y7SN42_COPMI|nr:hypothetical protein FA13DRAFT_1455661 [Coprinellus micaceus]